MSEQNWRKGRYKIQHRDLESAAGSASVELKQALLLSGYQSYPEYHHVTRSKKILYVALLTFKR